ncbi:outer membrane protein assembly factor BamB family protein [Streptosporangium sp. NBC_01756]|uniref:outer membrane protein assembly factor BamB family protein n=1 Tax=Streptosporangium sp. NBC_01756 TaxID=2975950 RepID=UPI002DDBEA5B|nr:PQQ-binding-like beta-propeller repeat protein [Streptosporangium sp. NBC_01756]WSC85558.1 PQQ-like beta-propeller repeat protein [Streptosporangium sp. NBC_01756]
MNDSRDFPSQGSPYPQQPYPGTPAQPYPEQPGGGYGPPGAQPYPQGQPYPQQQYPPQGQGTPPYGQYGPPGAPPYGQPPYQQGYPPPGQPQGPAHPPQGPGPYPQGPPYPQQQYPPPGPEGQPYPPGAQPDRPPAGRRTGRTVLFVALGLVALLGIGVGTAWFVSGGFGDEFGEGEWQVPFTAAGTEVIGTDASIAFGTWMSDAAVIRVQKDGVLAYDLKTGKRAWGTPAPGEQLCGATPGIAGGRGAFAYGTTKICDHLAGIDAKTGKVLWKVRIPATASKESDKSLDAPGLVLAGDLAVVRTFKRVSAYRLSDGKRIWASNTSKVCTATDVAASPKQVVVNLDCYEGGDSVVVLDGRTGAYKGEHRITDDDGGPDSLLSADPVVAAWGGGDKTFILVLDDRGKKLREFDSGVKVDLLPLNGAIYIDGGREELRTAVRGNTLYLTTFPENVKGGGISRNELLAFDLTSGRQLWKSSGTGATMLTFVEADGKDLLVMEEGGRNEPVPMLTRIDTATGRAVPVTELPQKAGGESGNAHVHYRNGTLVIMPFEMVASRYAVTVVRTG